jgi:hypothetical protein
MSSQIAIPDEHFYNAIYFVRGQKVMLDADLAELYAIETRVLKQAVRRNLERFPDDFMFELSEEEWNSAKAALRSQNVTLADSQRGRHSKYPPFAFTEQGVAMMSTVLNSPRAIAVNMHIMRVFVKMRELATNYTGLLEKINALQESDAKQNVAIQEIYQVIKALLAPEMKDRKPIGYRK